MNAGDYSYRFSGFAMDGTTPNYLVGVGVMTLDANNQISGHHTSAVAPIQDIGAVLKVAHFSLSGSFGAPSNPMGPNDLEAKILFTQLATDKDRPLQVLDTAFAVVPAGDADRFWLISTFAHNDTLKKLAIECVTGEAVKMKPLPRR